MTVVVFNLKYHWSVIHYVTIGLCYGLAPNRRQAITWTKVHIELWRHMALLGLCELISLYMSTHTGPHGSMCIEHMVTCDVCVPLEALHGCAVYHNLLKAWVVSLVECVPYCIHTFCFIV